MSHLRMSDEIIHRRGDVVDMQDAEILRLGNSVKRLDDVSPSADSMPAAIQKKDAQIKTLKAEVAALKLDIVVLNTEIVELKADLDTINNIVDQASGDAKKAPKATPGRGK